MVLMKYISFASGSSGNCGLLTDGQTHLLIDAGISCKRIRESLHSFNLEPDRLRAVLITHEHSDHVSGLSMLCKQTTIPVFVRGGTGRALLKTGKYADGRLTVYSPDDNLTFGNIVVRSMDIPHDAAEPVCYRFDGSEGSIVLMTDLGMVPGELERFAYGCKAAVLEFNHDIEMLKYGPYPRQTKQRILGNYGHLNNHYAADFARRLVDKGTERFLLAHLSAENNTAELAETAFLESIGTSAAMSIAPRNGFSEFLEI